MGKMRKKSVFSQVVLGGTFDYIHIGHLTLLKHAFSISKKLIIGISSDALVKEMGKKVEHDFQQRKKKLCKLIKKRFGRKCYKVIQLDDRFGPALDPKTDAIIVSEETETVADECNRIRKAMGLKSLFKIVIPILYSKDGEKISATRIRNREIDVRGISRV